MKEEPMAISLIIGLGNPGPKYQGNRHNIGFMAADEIARRWSFGPERAKFQSVIREGEVPTAAGPVRVLLMKPQTFMNLSGRSVRQLLGFYKWDIENILVAYDDVALPLGHLRFREKGSAGGHNGIKSLIEHLGGDGFPRLKMGIGGVKEGGGLTGHVLGKFAPDETETLQNMLATAHEAVQLSRSQGIALASNRFNTPRTKPTPKKEDEPQIRRSDCPDNEEPRGQHG